jgi:hypothetical protein
MGTRSLTIVKEYDGSEAVVMYRQFDGYPDGHGLDLAEFLKGKKIVNGIGMGDTGNFNGMGCLAAQMVAHFKTGIGNIYLYPSGTRDCWEEFIYKIEDNEGVPIIILYSTYGENQELLFSGTAEEMISWVAEKEKV